jgi:hypothetical protein
MQAALERLDTVWERYARNEMPMPGPPGEIEASAG